MAFLFLRCGYTRIRAWLHHVIIQESHDAGGTRLPAEPGTVVAMASGDQSTPPAAALPDELRGLTYDRATPEQVRQIREHVRAQLAILDAQWTPEERRQRHEEVRRRLDAA
jgi:hypothetical protein